MSNLTNNKKNSKCSINSTPNDTNKILSKMQMPKIPNIAVKALNILNNTNYIHTR